MKLAETHYDNTETGCCARLDRELWDEKRHEWTDRPFLRDQIRQFLHIPLNFGSVMVRDHAEAWVRAKGEEPEHVYFYYPTCPNCAKAFGKSEVVLFAKVA